jgi:hypothetical protein
MSINIVSPETLDAINAALETAKRLKEEIKRAQSAGIETDVKLEDVEKQEAQLRAIKATYFPAGRRSAG